MNIHEYQAKELFEKYGVATAPGKVARTPAEAEAVARGITGGPIVVKAQIHAGGRGKGTFRNGFQGGVHLVKTPEEAGKVAGQMLGQVLVTHQTGAEGRLVNQVLVAQGVAIAKEYYLAILMDRASGAPVVIASTEGGVDIESVAEHAPEKISREPVDAALGLQHFQARKIAHGLGFHGALNKPASEVIFNLFKLFAACDCSMVEVNPLVLTTENQVLALDAKFNFDDNAHVPPSRTSWPMRDTAEEDRARGRGEQVRPELHWAGRQHRLPGQRRGVGDGDDGHHPIRTAASPANFLDVGGGANGVSRSPRPSRSWSRTRT